MVQNTYQRAGTVINGERINIFFVENEDGELLIKAHSMWAEELGISYHQYSYKNDIISTVGRKNEEKAIKEFLDGKECFKVNAITGRAGNGKSRLVYYVFKDEKIKQDWSIYGVSYEELQYFKYHRICRLTEKGIMKKKILFVIDYVMINAKQIGKWIEQLYLDCKIDEGAVYIRILLVERAHVTEDRQPYWYLRLLEGNKLQNLELCDYRNHLQIHNLPDDQLNEIFVQYIEKKKEKYKTIYGTEPDYNICKTEADKIIKVLEKECKTPLYIMYIADAWINDNSKRGRNWSREEALEYVVMKEDERIKSFFTGNMKKVAALRKILVFSMVLNGVDLRKGQPSFLDKELELIREEFGDGNPNLSHLFNEVGELQSEKEVTLKSIYPEIVGEFYCLRYLTTIRENSFDDAFVQKFIQCAWSENPRAFAGFLCRIIEDFPDHKLVTFSGILEMPTFHNAESKVLYADVLREYTFWNQEILNYSDKIFESFESLFDGETCKEVLGDIYRKYASALFNMVWWYKSETDYNEMEDCINIILKKMAKVCGKADDKIVCQACRSMRPMIIKKRSGGC